jgi:hypothetical protein
MPATGNREEPVNEPYPLVFAFFALFAVNPDCSPVARPSPTAPSRSCVRRNAVAQCGNLTGPGGEQIWSSLPRRTRHPAILPSAARFHSKPWTRRRKRPGSAAARSCAGLWEEHSGASTAARRPDRIAPRPTFEPHSLSKVPFSLRDSRLEFPKGIGLSDVAAEVTRRRPAKNQNSCPPVRERQGRIPLRP